MTNKLYNVLIVSLVLLYFIMVLIGLIIDSTELETDTRPYRFLPKLVFMIFELILLIPILADIFLTVLNADKMKDLMGRSTRMEEILNFTLVVILFCIEIFVSNTLVRGFARARMLLFVNRAISCVQIMFKST